MDDLDFDFDPSDGIFIVADDEDTYIFSDDDENFYF